MLLSSPPPSILDFEIPLALLLLGLNFTTEPCIKNPASKVWSSSLVTVVFSGNNFLGFGVLSNIELVPAVVRRLRLK